MKLYRYSEIDGKFINEFDAYLDPVASQKEGKSVYMIPEFCTAITPPKINENELLFFKDNEWTIKECFIGKYICNENKNFDQVKEVGPIPEGYFIITKEEYENGINDFNYYTVKNNKLIKNKNKEEDTIKQRRELFNQNYIYLPEFIKNNKILCPECYFEKPGQDSLSCLTSIKALIDYVKECNGINSLSKKLIRLYQIPDFTKEDYEVKEFYPNNMNLDDSIDFINQIKVLLLNSF